MGINKIEFLCNKEGLDVKEITKILNKKSGLLGLSQKSNDLRELKDLDDEISSNEKITLENLIHKLEDAIKQKNYAVMEKLNEEVKRIFPAFCDLD